MWDYCMERWLKEGFPPWQLIGRVPEDLQAKWEPRWACLCGCPWDVPNRWTWGNCGWPQGQRPPPISTRPFRPSSRSSLSAFLGGWHFALFQIQNEFLKLTHISCISCFNHKFTWENWRVTVERFHLDVCLHIIIAERDDDDVRCHFVPK